MAQNAEIKCINKVPRNDPNESITHVGGYGSSRWKLTLADAIGRIERGEWNFYVSVDGRTVWVEVATSRGGNKYLRTQPDATQKNNLLSLPECP
ncbi:DUF3892 domain-containing protein [Pigmentiphaga sp. YJ18]|uniref:DUF3892 domain-containing protein n=1 Tax=Pigmentiphaga sp. YJ18 TaxID=3134907 RepID=UPI003117834F